MLMPDKHIKFSESLVGLGGAVLHALSAPTDIDELWEHFRRDAPASLVSHSFDNFVLAIDLLFAIGAVEEVGKTGVLKKCV